jgi:hypothetical protein
MKKLILFITLAYTLTANAQDADKTVTLVVSGSGKTQDEAKQNALRSAIEQAFGTFISSKTEILNDDLVKDEIVSVANGNIQNYEPISEVQLPDGGYASTFQATVSVSKLTSFCESKGVSIEFKGGVFSMKIKTQTIVENNEVATVKDACMNSKNIISKSFEYLIKTNEPSMLENQPDKWRVDFIVDVNMNSNYEVFKSYLISTLLKVSMSIEEIDLYKSLNKKYYCVGFNTDEGMKPIYLRSVFSLAYIQDLFWYSKFSAASFYVYDGNNKIALNDQKEYPWQETIEDYPVNDFFIDGRTCNKWFDYYDAEFPKINPQILGDKKSKYFISYNSLIDDRIDLYNRAKKHLIYYKKIYMEDSLAGKADYNYDHNPKRYCEAYNKLISYFADSSHVFSIIRNDPGSSGHYWEVINEVINISVDSQGKILNEESTNNINLNMAINLVKNNKNFGKFNLNKIYNTDELSKIQLFSIESTKISSN